MSGPEVGTQQPPRDCPASGFLNADRRLGRWAPGARQDAVDMRLGNARAQGQRPRGQAGVTEDRAKVGHPVEGNTAALTLQALGSHFINDLAAHTWAMSRFPQQVRLKAAVKAYQERTGKTQEEVAADLGTTLGTLRQWLNNKARKPELETLQKISALTKVSVAEFIDDPGREYAGQDLSDHSEEDRFFASMVIKGVLTKDLTDDQRRFIIEDVFRAVDRVRALGAPGARAGRSDHPGAKPGGEPGDAGTDPGRPPRK